MLIEVDNSGIPWTKPDDLLVDRRPSRTAKSATLDPSRNYYRREFFSSYKHLCGDIAGNGRRQRSLSYA